MRPAHHHQHSIGARAGCEMLAAVHPGRPRHRKKGFGEMLHQRHHACRIQDAVGEMDGSNPNATTPAEYQNGTPRWRTDLYANSGTLMTHDESIALIKSLGAKFTPELKAPEVAMPFDR